MYFSQKCCCFRKPPVTGKQQLVRRSLGEELPGIQVDGQVVHSLKGVTMQSFLQGSKQGRTVSGRVESEHLNIQTVVLNSLHSPGDE